MCVQLQASPTDDLAGARESCQKCSREPNTAECDPVRTKIIAASLTGFFT